MDAPVFKIGGRLREAGCCGFDSHPLPLIFDVQLRPLDEDYALPGVFCSPQGADFELYWIILRVEEVKIDDR